MVKFGETVVLFFTVRRNVKSIISLYFTGLILISFAISVKLLLIQKNTLKNKKLVSFLKKHSYKEVIQKDRIVHFFWYSRQSIPEISSGRRLDNWEG